MVRESKIRYGEQVRRLNEAWKETHTGYMENFVRN